MPFSIQDLSISSLEFACRSGEISPPVAVLGAHMRGLALNEQLVRLGGTYITTSSTAPSYRLYALPVGSPERSGLVRGHEQGAAIELELWALPCLGVGELLGLVPRPLSIGSLELADGSWVQGFLCKAYAVETATDITHYGGYRAYLSAQRERKAALWR